MCDLRGAGADCVTTGFVGAPEQTCAALDVLLGTDRAGDTTAGADELAAAPNNQDLLPCDVGISHRDRAALLSIDLALDVVELRRL